MLVDELTHTLLGVITAPLNLSGSRIFLNKVAHFTLCAGYCARCKEQTVRPGHTRPWSTIGDGLENNDSNSGTCCDTITPKSCTVKTLRQEWTMSRGGMRRQEWESEVFWRWFLNKFQGCSVCQVGKVWETTF